MNKKNYLILSIAFLIAFLAILVSFNYCVLDQSVNRFFAENQSKFLSSFSNLFAFIFDAKCIIALILICSISLWFSDKRKDSIFLVYLGISYGILVFLLKNLVERARPDNLIETGFSFPSGHATISIIFLGFWIYFCYSHIKNMPIKIITICTLALLIFFVCISRLILGVHWFSDVLSGIILGGFILFGGIWLRRTI